jgi:DNA-binding CsgD family transcriptional regulator
MTGRFHGNRARSRKEPDHDGAMTFQEIANRIGTTRQNVWFHYRNALRKLRRDPRARALLKLR